ncbi:MAG: sigma-70 family RNA polymerase sigma factor [Micromonosporaceae bacterium]|nr:sigma-70 family RNA polymerase sigma factor [Micromonosporaceae bacterium]
MADSDGFDTFYRGTTPRLLRYAYGLTADLGEAQDIVQEAYARAWQRWRRLRDCDDREGWLRLVVDRLATDSWRRLLVRRAAITRRTPPPPALPPPEDVIVLIEALRTLPFAHRRALAMFYLLDRSITDIARETGASLGTVKSWLSRGRDALATALRDQPEEASTGGSDAR